MPRYQIVVTKNTATDLATLNPTTRNQIKQKLEFYLGQPHPLSFAVKLINSQDGNYRWRSGDYRIVFDLDDKNIVSLRIQHRRDIYRN